VSAERGKARTAVAAMLRVTAVMIDWSTAVVKPTGRYLELAVRLTPAPDRCGRTSSPASATCRTASSPSLAGQRPDFDELTVVIRGSGLDEGRVKPSPEATKAAR
jgi:hypothetical protein